MIDQDSILYFEPLPQDFPRGQWVRYIPDHADSANHPDVDYGIVSGRAKTGVWVRFFTKMQVKELGLCTMLQKLLFANKKMLSQVENRDASIVKLIKQNYSYGTVYDFSNIAGKLCMPSDLEKIMGMGEIIFEL